MGWVRACVRAYMRVGACGWLHSDLPFWGSSYWAERVSPRKLYCSFDCIGLHAGSLSHCSTRTKPLQYDETNQLSMVLAPTPHCTGPYSH